ncbi:MAG: hypothetical protein ACSW8F_00115 [bacterium]
MYKKEMQFQKIVCLLCIISAALVFIYALGIMTDLYDSFYFTMRNPDDHYETKVPGSIIYYDMQEFNGYFLKLSIVLILAAVLLFITNTNVRRRYYIGNYVTVGIVSVLNIYAAVDVFRYVSYFKNQYLTTVDFAALKEYAEGRANVLYTESTFWFDIYYLVFGILLVATCLLIVNTVWKIRLMKDEAALLGKGKEAKA